MAKGTFLGLQGHRKSISQKSEKYKKMTNSDTADLELPRNTSFWATAVVDWFVFKSRKHLLENSFEFYWKTRVPPLKWEPVLFLEQQAAVHPMSFRQTIGHSTLQSAKKYISTDWKHVGIVQIGKIGKTRDRQQKMCVPEWFKKLSVSSSFDARTANYTVQLNRAIDETRSLKVDIGVMSIFWIRGRVLRTDEKQSTNKTNPNQCNINWCENELINPFNLPWQKTRSSTITRFYEGVCCWTSPSLS